MTIDEKLAKLRRTRATALRAEMLWLDVRDNARLPFNRRYYAAVRLDDVEELLSDCTRMERRLGKTTHR